MGSLSQESKGSKASLELVVEQEMAGISNTVWIQGYWPGLNSPSPVPISVACLLYIGAH